MENDLQQNTPQSIDELQSLVRDSQSISIRGREDRTGPPIQSPQPTHISLSAFQKVVEYQPEEYTITVEAGAKVRTVCALLAEHGQYLPFDPPFIQDETTVGEMVTNGFSGPGAYRYGILRDFILGLTFIDGLGNRIKAGGKVVKNAAGFDIPKLMVGSGGSFGIITELTFKVFPLPETYRTIVFRFERFEKSHAALLALGRSQFTLDALDLDPNGSLVIRLSGQRASMETRIQALDSMLGKKHESLSENDAFWHPSTTLQEYPETGWLLKLPSSPTGIADLESKLASHSKQQRYSIGGFVTWIHGESSIDEFTALLESLKLSAQVVSGDAPNRIIGESPQRVFYDRIKKALDPHRKFNDIYPGSR
jgi:glycolate oxidase FAD binding subunit